MCFNNDEFHIFWTDDTFNLKYGKFNQDTPPHDSLISSTLDDSVLQIISFDTIFNKMALIYLKNDTLKSYILDNNIKKNLAILPNRIINDSKNNQDIFVTVNDNEILLGWTGFCETIGNKKVNGFRALGLKIELEEVGNYTIKEICKNKVKYDIINNGAHGLYVNYKNLPKETLHIKLISLNGKTINEHKHKIMQTDGIINLSKFKTNLAKGIYFLEMNQFRSSTKHVIKLIHSN